MRCQDSRLGNCVALVLIQRTSESCDVWLSLKPRFDKKKKVLENVVEIKHGAWSPVLGNSGFAEPDMISLNCHTNIIIKQYKMKVNKSVWYVSNNTS